jgi:hypothetical protein
MKTASTPVPQFSGYPLKPVPPDEMQASNVMLATIGKSTASSVEIKTKNLTDVPENWDDSWFANYE